MTTALIGYTGFVGSNIASQHNFTDYYNSKTINKIKNKNYDFLVLSGIRAEKWKANSDPLADWDAIENLIGHLLKVSAKKVVVVSTVDVFQSPLLVDESSPVTMLGLHPYGKHRRLFEEFCTQRFDSLIVRLPGLFGKGLKKNIIFDLMHNNQIDRIDPASSFQWYFLGTIWRDISVALKHDLELIHFATEPILTREILYLFGNPAVENPSDPPVRYDFRTQYDDFYNGHDGYIYKKEYILEKLKRFIASEKDNL